MKTIRNQAIKLSTLIRLMAAWVLFGWLQTGGAVEPQSEYKIKSAYLYNFSKFTHLPDSHFKNEPYYDLCIIGENYFGNFLDPLANRDVDGKTLRLHFLSHSEFLDECEVLFISRSETKHLSKLLETAARFKALTVSDIDDFANQGGMIGLLTEGNRIRFEINTEVAQTCQIDISAKLLELGKIVSTDKQGGAKCPQ